MTLRAIKPWKPKPALLGSTRWFESQLDDLTSKIVLFNEKVCFIIGCGVRKDLQNGHLLERRHRHTRWDIHSEGNCHAQCPLHNSLHEGHPEIYRTDFVLKYGQPALDELERRARSMQKITPIELEEKYLEYKAIWERIRGKAA
jgi:NinG protein